MIQDRLEVFAVDPSNPTTTETTRAVNEAKEWYLAMAFLAGSDRTRYGGLLIDMENSYMQGVTRYPQMLVQAYNDLNNYKVDTRSVPRSILANDGVNFQTLDQQDHQSEIDESLTGHIRHAGSNW